MHRRRLTLCESFGSHFESGRSIDCRQLFGGHVGRCQLEHVQFQPISSWRNIDISSTARKCRLFNPSFRRPLNLLNQFQALKDDIHVVVKQSLNAVKDVLPALLRHHDVAVIFNGKNDFDTDAVRKLLPLNESASSHRLTERILDEIAFVHNNKYWVVQNCYADFIAKLDFIGLRAATDVDVADNYRDQFMSHIYAMLGDNDQRVRNAAADALSEFIGGYKSSPEEIQGYDDRILLNELIAERIFADLPSPLSDLMSDAGKSNQIDELLGKCLFHLSNLLLSIECKQRQVRLPTAISPIHFNLIGK